MIKGQYDQYMMSTRVMDWDQGSRDEVVSLASDLLGPVRGDLV